MKKTLRRARILTGFVLALLATSVPSMAQLAPSEPDPLARIRDAAKNNVQACSATGETLCEQVAPKIIANAEGDSPLADSFLRLREVLRAQSHEADKDPAAVTWAKAAFQSAGLEARTERYLTAEALEQRKGGTADIVIAEIRGREKPDDWVLLSADIDPSLPGGADTCDAALVVEAARDIQLTGVRPRRSIRFILFGGETRGMTGPWAYLKGHSKELDHAAAALIFETCGIPVGGFSLNGRHDLEAGVRDAVKPIESMGVVRFLSSAPFDRSSIDFLLQGVPTVTAIPAPGGPPPSEIKLDIALLKRNTAIAAVTAFGIAERAEPIGPRQSRAEIESLLTTSRLEEQMKATGIWPLWESGKRGRTP
jgi:peptidase M28-like protein